MGMRFRSRVLVRLGVLCVLVWGLTARAGELAPAFSDDQLLGTLHRINRMQIEAGRMAEKNAAARAVKRYGKTLVREHGRADRDLASYARKTGVDLDAALPAGMNTELTAARTKLNNLQTLHGSVFDQDFANLMVRDHQRAIALVRQGRAQVNDPRLKSMLSQMETELRAHKQTAASLLR